MHVGDLKFCPECTSVAVFGGWSASFTEFALPVFLFEIQIQSVRLVDFLLWRRFLFRQQSRARFRRAIHSADGFAALMLKQKQSVLSGADVALARSSSTHIDPSSSHPTEADGRRMETDTK